MLRKWGTKYAAMLQLEKFQSSQQFGGGYTTSAIIRKGSVDFYAKTRTCTHIKHHLVFKLEYYYSASRGSFLWLASPEKWCGLALKLAFTKLLTIFLHSKGDLKKASNIALPQGSFSTTLDCIIFFLLDKISGE